MPAVATGDFTPYRVRVDDTPASTESIANELRKLASDRDEDVSNQRDQLNTIIELLSRLRLNVDGKSLERTLDSMRNDRVRAFGGAY